MKKCTEEDKRSHPAVQENNIWCERMALMLFLGGEDVFTLFQTDFEFPQHNPAEEKIKAKLISYPWLWKIYLNTFQFFLKYQMFFPWIHGFLFYDSTNTSRFVHTIWNRWYFARSIQLLQRHWGHLHWVGTMRWTTLGVPAENFLLIIGFRFWHPTSVCTRQVWGIWGIWVFDAATVRE